MSTGSPFPFRLERIRALRERREDLARQELAQAISRLSDSQDRLRAVDADLERVHAEQRQACASPTLAAEELRARQAFAEYVEAKRQARMQDLVRHEADVAECGDELGNAAREHQMLERLKERQRAEYDREASRREAILLDEIATSRFRGSAA